MAKSVDYFLFYSFFRKIFNFACLSLGLILLAIPANAHHPWDGLDPDSFTPLQGLLSGLAHPVFGFDHFLFLFSIGLFGTMFRLRWILPLISCGFAGSLLAQLTPSINGSELFIGISLIVSAFVSLGYLNPLWIFPFITLHGFVLGEGIIGAEPTPIIAYIFGLVIIQSLILLLGLFSLRRISKYKQILSFGLIGIGLIATLGVVVN